MSPKGTSNEKQKKAERKQSTSSRSSAEQTHPQHGNPATAGSGGETQPASSHLENRKDTSHGHVEKGKSNLEVMERPVSKKSPTGSVQAVSGHAGSGQLKEVDPSFSTTYSESGGKKSFRCADAGYRQCTWQVEGTEQELLPQIERHAKDVHHVQMKPEAREQVRHLMRDAA